MSSGFDDEVTQKSGVVNITSCRGRLLNSQQYPSSFAEHLRRVGSLLSAMPHRFSSTHFLYDDPGLRVILSGLHKNFGKNVRLRMKSHFGSPFEQEYSLLSFGISCLGMFLQEEVTDGSTEIYELIERFYRNRRLEDDKEKERMQQKEATSGIIIYPTPDIDVLIGRGHPYHDYSGTRRLLRLIDSELARYNKDSDQFYKTCIAMETVTKVKEWNGRFLRRTEKGWIVLDDVTARRKVVNLFRYKKHIQENGPLSNSSKRVKRSK